MKLRKEYNAVRRRSKMAFHFEAFGKSAGFLLDNYERDISLQDVEFLKYAKSRAEIITKQNLQRADASFKALKERRMKAAEQVKEAFQPGRMSR